MSLSRRTFTKEFKEAAVRRLEMGASLAEVARACEVNPNVLHRWRRELRDYGAKAFSGNGKNRAEENRLAELERKVGRQAMEIDFLRRCLQHVEEQRKLQALTTRGSSTRTSQRNETGHAASGATAVCARQGQPCRFLPLAACAFGDGCRCGPA